MKKSRLTNSLLPKSSLSLTWKAPKRTLPDRGESINEKKEEWKRVPWVTRDRRFGSKLLLENNSVVKDKSQVGVTLRESSCLLSEYLFKEKTTLSYTSCKETRVGRLTFPAKLTWTRIASQVRGTKVVFILLLFCLSLSSLFKTDETQWKDVPFPVKTSHCLWYTVYFYCIVCQSDWLTPDSLVIHHWFLFVVVSKILWSSLRSIDILVSLPLSCRSKTCTHFLSERRVSYFFFIIFEHCMCWLKKSP